MTILPRIWRHIRNSFLWGSVDRVDVIVAWGFMGFAVLVGLGALFFSLYVYVHYGLLAGLAVFLAPEAAYRVAWWARHKADEAVERINDEREAKIKAENERVEREFRQAKPNGRVR